MLNAPAPAAESGPRSRPGQINKIPDDLSELAIDQAAVKLFISTRDLQTPKALASESGFTGLDEIVPAQVTDGPGTARQSLHRQIKPIKGFDNPTR